MDQAAPGPRIYTEVSISWFGLSLSQQAGRQGSTQEGLVEALGSAVWFLV